MKNRDTAERLRVAKYEHKIVDPINYTTNNVIVFIYVSIIEQIGMTILISTSKAPSSIKIAEYDYHIIYVGMTIKYSSS